MKTEVVMKRDFFLGQISQKSKSEFFSATDLVREGNKWRKERKMSLFNLSGYLSQKGTIEFMESLEEKTMQKVIIKGRGRGKHTWVHPFLFIDIALAISPKLKIEVYEWLSDKLLAYRNDSGDSFKKMAGALYFLTGNKKAFTSHIKILSNDIRLFCGVQDWQTASEDQLKTRDKIQETIALLCDVLQNPDDAIRIAFEKH